MKVVLIIALYCLLHGGMTYKLNDSQSKKALGLSSFLEGTTYNTYDRTIDCCARFYEHKDFTGSSLELCKDSEVSNLKDKGWNDKISSFEIDDGCAVKIYQNAKFKGERDEFTNSVTNLKNECLVDGAGSHCYRFWNDRVSAIKVYLDPWYAARGYT